jgi:predicted MFS family arabinose efflux permease
MTESDPATRAPVAGDDAPATGPSDRSAALTVVLAFSFSLGIGQLALPLLALAAGYDPVAIGLLTATSAISQFGLRLGLPALLGRFPDRAMITLSCVLMGASYGILLISAALPVFVAAQLAQGGARALFWTASQTHAVRTPGDPTRSLAQVGAVGNLGTMVGPAVTGAIATVSIQAALGLGVVVATIAALLTLRLITLLPYDRRPRRAGQRRLWLRPGIDVACWAGFVGGGWRALMGSYVPVLLTTAGLPPTVVGGLLSAADLAATATITSLVRVPPRWTRRALDLAVIAAAVGLAALPLAAGDPILSLVLLIISGAGAGPLMTLSVSAARQLSEASEEGDAIALVGTFRALALLVVPTGVAASLAVLPVALALSIAGLGMGLPAVVLGRRQR